MCHENIIENARRHEAAEVHAPAASTSEIISRKNPMSNMWPFVGGVLVGAVGMVAVALLADRLACEEGGGADLRGKNEPLALPEGGASPK